MPARANRNDAEVVVLESKGGGRSAILNAGASLQDVYQASGISDLLASTLGGTLSWQSRNENTVLRVLQSPTMAPRFVAALLALGVRVLSGEDEEELLADYLERSEARDVPASAIRMSIGIPGRVWGEASVSRTPADQPIVAAVAVLDLTNGEVRQARLALAGTWRGPVGLAGSVESLVGGPLDEKRISEVAAAVEREVEPRSDYRGSADYRRALAPVLARRSLEDCWKGVERS